MILLKVNCFRKQRLMWGFLLLFVCLLANLAASAQEDDIFNAAAKGDLVRVQALLTNGTDVNARNANRATALLWAAYFGKVDVVQLLLAKGAEINAQDNDGATALFMASKQDQLNVVQTLSRRKQMLMRGRRQVRPH